MRLLYYDACCEVCLTDNLPLDHAYRYAVLSHTWGADRDEVKLQELREGVDKNKPGFAKIQFCGQQANKDELKYFWVDTCCIDKTNSTELHENINSMFSIYSKAEKCYAYLSDVSSRKRDSDGQREQLWKETFTRSRWFTRGWTLQELLAPKTVEFFARDNQMIASKEGSTSLIAEITGIPERALRGDPLSTFSPEEKWKWSAKRNTTRPEDKVYCLLGIFGVHMPLIYGEGDNALDRLKDEIAKTYRRQLDRVDSAITVSQPNNSQDQVRDRHEELLASLSFDQMDSRRSTIKSAYSTTCKWLLNHPTYLQWTNPACSNQHRGFLWIRGKPGAGKSTLIKFAHAKAGKERSPDPDILVSFFFNARGADLEKTTIGMYRSIAYQLLKATGDLQDLLNELFPSTDDAVRFSGWTIDSLQTIISTSVAKLGQRRLKCFIDALDECDEEEIREMIIFFEDLTADAVANGCHICICFASRHYPAIDVQHGLKLTLESEDGHSEDLAKYIRNHLRAGKGHRFEEIREHVLEKANGVFMWAVLVVDILNKEFLSGRIYAVEKRLQQIPPKLSDLFRDILQRDSQNMEELLLCLQWVLFAKRPLASAEFYLAMVTGLDPSPENVEWSPDMVTEEDLTRFVTSSSKGLAELTKSKTPTVQFIHESVRDFLLKDGGLSQMWAGIERDLHSVCHDKLKQCCRQYLSLTHSAFEQFLRSWDGPGGLRGLASASSDCGKNDRHKTQLKFPFLDYASRYVLDHADEAAASISQKGFLETFSVHDWVNITNVFARFDTRRHSTEASLLYILAENNYAVLIDTLRPCEPNTGPRGERYGYPLRAAWANRHFEALRALLPCTDSKLLQSVRGEMESAPKFKLRKDQTPLLWALENEHIGLAEVLADSDQTILLNNNRNGRNALSLAAGNGYLHVVDILTRDNANLSLTGSQVARALQQSQSSTERATHSRIDWVNKPDENISSIRRMTPLMWASKNGHEMIVTMLLDRGAHLETILSAGWTALHWAAYSGECEVVQELLNRGAEMEARDNVARTALIVAVTFGQVRVVKQLLDLGANIDHSDNTGNTALMTAIQCQYPNVVRQLLNSGPDLDTKTNNDNTALILAVRQGQVDVVRQLCDLGAYVEARNNKGKTALMEALRCSNEQIEHQLVQQLLKQTKDLEIMDNYGGTALLYAVEFGSAESVQLLLDHGACIEVWGRPGHTALNRTATPGHESVVQRLPFDGAQVANARCVGFTPLMGAARRGSPAIIQQLLDRGADIETKTSTGRTALFYAAVRYHCAAALLLLDRGASPGNAGSDQNGWTVLDMAHNPGMEAVLQRLQIDGVFSRCEMLESSGTG